MSEPGDYLAAAIAIEMMSPHTVVESRPDIVAIFQNNYGISLTDNQANILIGKLAAWRGISISSDKYAGETIRISRSILEKTLEGARDVGGGNAVLNNVRLNGKPWLTRVFSNSAFWTDLEGEAVVASVPENTSGEDIPASDRTVTLNHNQFTAIDGPVEELIVALDADNGIPDELGLREKILGQIRAGRELLRAGVFDGHLFYLSMVVGLKLLIEKYKDHIVGALASKLLDAIIEQLGNAIS